MLERSRPSLEEYVRERVTNIARRRRIAPDDHRLENVRTLALELRGDGRLIDAAIAVAWDLVFPSPRQHPRRGTRWQRVIGRYPPGVPLLYGKPDR